MTDAPTPPAMPPGTLTFETVVTLEDLLVLQMRCLASPTMRAGRLRRDAVIVLAAAACAPFVVAGSAFLASAGRHGVSSGALLRSLVLDQPGTVGLAVLFVVACAVGGAVLQRWLTRPWMRRVLRRILRARPDVDPSDPRLAYRARVIVSDEGIESRTGIGAAFLRWTVLKRWEETGQHLLVLGDAMVGVCVCTVAVDPGALERFRAVLTTQLGPKGRAR